MGVGRRALSVLGKIGTALAIVITFFIGLLGTVYLSLRTSEVKVPDLLGKDRFAAEAALSDAGLNIRIKGSRPSAEKPDTILSQLPEGGMVVKAGQTVAVEISRAPKEGESVPSGEATKPEEGKPQENANANQSSATNQNQNQNQNKPKNKNKNANNSNNSNNANNRNANNSNNANSNRNANGRNMNANRTPSNANNGNRVTNSTTTPNANRGNTNANRRAPVGTTPPFNPGTNRRTP